MYFCPFLLVEVLSYSVGGQVFRQDLDLQGPNPDAKGTAETSIIIFLVRILNEHGERQTVMSIKRYLQGSYFKQQMAY